MTALPTTFPGTGFNTIFGERALHGQIHLCPQALLFESEEANCAFPLDRVQIAAERGGRIAFTDPEQPDWLLVAPDDQILQHHLFHQRNQLRRQVNAIRQAQAGRQNLRLAGLFLVSVALVVLLFLGLSRLTVRFLARRVPLAWEENLGRNALQAVGEYARVVDDPHLPSGFTDLTRRLERTLPSHPYRFQFLLLEDPMPNALSLPGGKILICRGLFDFAESPEELAAVLAHEMAHVIQRHGLQQLISDAGPYYVLRVFISDRSGFAALVAGGSLLLLQQGHSRQCEREADRLAARYLLAAHINPRGARSFLERLSRSDREILGQIQAGPRALRSHPDLAERLRHFRELERRWPSTSPFVDLTDSDWKPAGGWSSSAAGGYICSMKCALLSLGLWLGGLIHVSAAAYPDRLVWIFGWNLGRENDVAEITPLLDTAGQHGLNGAVVSFGLDTLCQKSPDYLRRLEAVQAACARNRLELIPAVCSVGYGGAALAHDRNLAEGLPVEDALFVVQGAEARFWPDESAKLANGGFEEHSGDRFKGYNFHDQPGEVSFADTQVRHSGQVSLRLENFTANPHGHGRVMQEIRVRPHRVYRVSLWVKTDALTPTSAFQVSVLAGNRSLAPRTFTLPGTVDWRKLTMLFNSLNHEAVRLYAGLWGGKSGRLWLDDWMVEEVGPLNVLHRPGTPVTVRSEDGARTYTEGRDYAPLKDPGYSPYQVERAAPPLKLPPNSRIVDGQRLRVSWFHPLVVHDSQITVCMAEPALYDIYEHEAKLLAEHLHPRRVMLNMDEIRMGGTCLACRDRNMGELLGECITKLTHILRRHNPGLGILIWSDMLDPNHNAHGDYYLVQGDYTGSWKTVPKELTIAVWGGSPREQSLRFFAEEGFPTLVACYYDADDLDEVKAWLELARPLKNVRGFMYTPWQKKYSLLPAFGDLLQGQP